MEIIALLAMILVGILLIRNAVLKHQRDSNINKVYKLREETKTLEIKVRKLESSLKDLENVIQVANEIEDYITKTATKFIKRLAVDLDKKKKVGYSNDLLSNLDVTPIRKKEFGKYAVDYRSIGDNLISAAPEKPRPVSPSYLGSSYSSDLRSNRSPSSNRRSDESYSPSSYSYDSNSYDSSSYDSSSYDSSSSSCSSSDSSSGGFCD